MSITIKEVAAAAGVSTATVSKVLNRSPSISQPTINRVNAVMEQLGYHPNKRAQNFARQATKTVLFLAQMGHGVGFDNPHMFEILAGIEETLGRKNYSLLVKGITAPQLAEQWPSLSAGESVDGIILHASVVSKEVAGLLAATALPYVVVGMPDFSNRLCWIDSNNAFAGQIAARHLLALGYDRIAYIGGPRPDTISSHRLSGVLEALSTTMPAGYIRHGEPTCENGEAGALALLGLETPPNAVICANQYIALGCVNVLHRCGVTIPQEMAVITFDDFPFSKVIDPNLTVVNIDMHDMGCEAGKIMLQKIKKPQLLVQTYTTLPVLIHRAST